MHYLNLRRVSSAVLSAFAQIADCLFVMKVVSELHEMVATSLQALAVDSTSDSSEYSDAQDTLSSGEEEGAEADPLESLDDSLFVPDIPDDTTSKAMKEPLCTWCTPARCSLLHLV